MIVAGTPSAALDGQVSAYFGFSSEAATPLQRREGPRPAAVVIVNLGEDWLIDGERLTSFAAGLHDRQVTTENVGRSFGIHVDVAPPAAYTLFRVPMHRLARRTVPLEDVLDEPSLGERLLEAGDWADRFRLLDRVLAKRLATAPPPSTEVAWAWQRLVATGGRTAIRMLAEELGWSRKRLVARFREEVGLPPKRAARLLRFDRARTLAERSGRPDWTRIALECGYYDQSHLINEFREVTGRTPETFLQDAPAAAA